MRAITATHLSGNAVRGAYDDDGNENAAMRLAIVAHAQKCMRQCRDDYPRQCRGRFYLPPDNVEAPIRPRPPRNQQLDIARWPKRLSSSLAELCATPAYHDFDPQNQNPIVVALVARDDHADAIATLDEIVAMDRDPFVDATVSH